jgi:aryl-alcohol dehydrogenase-like predicted oxidoreductase
VQEVIEKNRTKLEAYEHCCSELEEDPALVALAWLLANPVVTAPIIGPRTPEQLDATLHALEIPMSKQTLEKLGKIFPGPGGRSQSLRLVSQEEGHGPTHRSAGSRHLFRRRGSLF